MTLKQKVQAIVVIIQGQVPGMTTRKAIDLAYDILEVIEGEEEES